MVTLRDAVHHIQVNTEALAICFLMHSSQVAIITPRPVGCREELSWGERRERRSTWVRAVYRQHHGAYSFSMTSAARPGALVTMEQANIHLVTSNGRLMDPAAQGSLRGRK